MRLITTMLIMTLATAACSSTTPKQYSTAPWQDFGYEGMAGKINRMTGSESINCGIRNFIDPNDPVNKTLSLDDSKTCIKYALASSTPFRYGSIRIPTDSYLFDVLLLDSNGKIWTIQYDSMIDSSNNVHNIKICESVKVNYSDLSYAGTNCTGVPTEQWLRDIPEQSGE